MLQQGILTPCLSTSSMFLGILIAPISKYKDEDKRRDDASHEETAHKVAWAAVKKKYKKDGDDWIAK